MVNQNALGGYDNVTFPPGWTDQLTTNPGVGAALDSYGGGNALGYNNPGSNSYLGWSMTPEDATASVAVTTTNGYLTRIVSSTGGPCGHLDVVFTSSGAVTNAVFALYNAAAFAVGPLGWSADVHTTVTGAAGLYSLTWGGASSPASVNLVAGQTYWIYTEITGTSPTLSGTNASGFTLNSNLTASASFADNSMMLSSAAPTSITSSTTLTPQTTWVAGSTIPGKFWFGLRA